VVNWPSIFLLCRLILRVHLRLFASNSVVDHQVELARVLEFNLVLQHFKVLLLFLLFFSFLLELLLVLRLQRLRREGLGQRKWRDIVLGPLRPERRPFGINSLVVLLHIAELGHTGLDHLRSRWVFLEGVFSEPVSNQ